MQNKQEAIETSNERDSSDDASGEQANSAERAKNVVALEPDVAAAFPDSESVNQALRAFLAIIEKQAEGINQQ